MRDEVPICFSVEIEIEVKKLFQRFNASYDRSAYANFHTNVALEKELGLAQMEKILGLPPSKRRVSSIFKKAGDDRRIFANYFASVMVMEEGKRIFKPMRYRVRPKNSQTEIPAKYNVFNARIDALMERKTWRPLFMRNHGLFPFIKFYEWVEHNGKTKLIMFKPEEHTLMWAPCIFDTWESLDKRVHFESFALLTDNPPPEIAEKGHDRCPIFLREDLIDDWLQPSGKTKTQMYKLLKETEPVYFESLFAA